MVETFGYHAVQRKARPRPTSVIVTWFRGDQPLRAVIWNSPERVWKYDPTAAATLLYDDHFANQVRPVSRVEAERIAREDIGAELPSEEEIRRICEEGSTQGRNSGLPT